MPSSYNAETLRQHQAAAPDREALLAELFELDVADVDDDLPFYEELARACDGPLLELGAGAGRGADPLARAGFEVWGIDTSDAMLARARCNAGPDVGDRLHLVRADMRNFDLDRRFDLVFAAFGTFHHLLTPEDQLACLRSVERHLAPGGLFACDVRPLWRADWEEGTSVPLLHDWTRVLPSTGETVTKLRSVRADRAHQIQHETHIYDCLSPDGALRRIATTLDLRFTTRYELAALLRAAGLRPEQMYGDFDLSPFDDTSELMITVARKPAAAGKEAT
jgi:SAM-dependent methyltransferase